MSNTEFKEPVINNVEEEIGLISELGS